MKRSDKNPVVPELFRRNLNYYQNVVTVLILLALTDLEPILLTTTEDDIYITVWNLYFIRPLRLRIEDQNAK